jgi:GrpB-like predicted nucleotidyltransferase (UPF0157 family)
MLNMVLPDVAPHTVSGSSGLPCAYIGRVADQRGTRPPIVVDYQADWPVRAAAITDKLAAALGPLAVRIEHIGSTSIPAMAAKDVIDLQVSTPDLEAAAVAFADPLRDLEFERFPYAYDHVPAGRQDSQELWAKRFWARREHADGPVNLHVRVVGSPNERLALLFRDWFRAHPAAVQPYAEFKRGLAAVTGDIVSYTEVKDPVVDVVIVAAEAWAVSTGWHL